MPALFIWLRREVLWGVLLFLAFAAADGHSLSARQQAHAAIDAWHRAAARADEGRYFALFARDAVFLGSDATERWTLGEFRKWAHPYFAKGKAWTLVPVERHLSFAPDGAVAWFDELLQSPAYGRCRGSGVVLLEGGEWKVGQYNFSVPIPNDLMSEFVKRIRTKR